MELRNVFLTSILLGASVACGAEAAAAGSIPTACAVSYGIQRTAALEAVVPSDGRVVFQPGGPGFVDRDGALGIKWAWVRRIPGELIVGGRRLDGDAPPARSYRPRPVASPSRTRRPRDLRQPRSS